MAVSRSCDEVSKIFCRKTRNSLKVLHVIMVWKIDLNMEILREVSNYADLFHPPGFFKYAIHPDGFVQSPIVSVSPKSRHFRNH